VHCAQGIFVSKEMTMRVLGVSAYYQDSAVAYVKDNLIKKAVKEQHFSRELNTSVFPSTSLRWVKEAYEDFDHIVFYEEKTFNQFKSDIKRFSKTKPELVDHHEAHAMSGLLMSDCSESAVIVADMLGGSYSLSLGYYHNGSFSWIKRFTYPNSLGLLYSSVTRFLGFTPLEDEYKTMYSARKGKPLWKSWAYDNIIDFSDNNFELLIDSTRGIGRGFLDHNIASTAQTILEEIMVSLANWLQSETGSFNLVFSGQLATNTDLCRALKDLTSYNNIIIPSDPGEAGCALGAAALVSRPLWESPYLGKLSEDLIFVEDCADKILKGTITPVIHGRTEFSYSSLGNRSFLCIPTEENIQKLNMIKNTPSWVSYPVVCQEKEAGKFFDIDIQSYYKQFTYSILNTNYKHEYTKQTVQLVNMTKNAYINKILEKTKQYGFPFLICADLSVEGKPLVNTIEDYNNEI